MRDNKLFNSDINLIRNGELLVSSNSPSQWGLLEVLRRKNTDAAYLHETQNHGRFIVANWLVGQINIPTNITWNIEWQKCSANVSSVGANTTTNPASNGIFLYIPTKLSLPNNIDWDTNLATHPISLEDIAPYIGEELILSFEVAMSLYTWPATNESAQFSVALVYPHGEKSTVYTYVLDRSQLGYTPVQIQIPIKVPEDWLSNISNGKYAPITNPGSGGKIIFSYFSNRGSDENSNGEYNADNTSPNFRHVDDYPLNDIRSLILRKVHLGPRQPNYIFKYRPLEAVRLSTMARQQGWDSGHGVIAKNEYIPFTNGDMTIVSNGGYVGYKFGDYGDYQPKELRFKEVDFLVSRLEAQLSSNTVIFECFTQNTAQDLSGFPATSCTLKITISDGFISHTHTLRESSITKSGNPLLVRITNSCINAGMTSFINASVGKVLHVKIERVEEQYLDVVIPHITATDKPKQFLEGFRNSTNLTNPYPYKVFIKGTSNAGFKEPGKIIKQDANTTTVRIKLNKNALANSVSSADAKDIGTKLLVTRNHVSNTIFNWLDDLTPEPLDDWFGCLMKPGEATVKVTKRISGTFFDSKTGGGTRPSSNLTTNTVLSDPTQEIEAGKPVPVIGSVYWGNTTMGSSLLLIDVDRGEMIIERFMRRDPADIDLSLYQVRLVWETYPGGLTTIIPLKLSSDTMFIGTAVVGTDATNWFYNNPDTLVVPFTFHLEPKP